MTLHISERHMHMHLFIIDVIIAIITKRLRNSKESEINSNHMKRKSFMKEVLLLYLFFKRKSQNLVILEIEKAGIHLEKRKGKFLSIFFRSI